MARKRSGPEGFLDGEERDGQESRSIAERKEPRAGSGEHTAFPNCNPKGTFEVRKRRRREAEVEAAGGECGGAAAEGEARD